MSKGLTAWWQRRRRRLLEVWGFGVAVSIAVTAASATGLFEPTQGASLDLLLRLRGPQLSSDVVIVAIDDVAFESLGQRQPIPRHHLVKVLRGLRRSGAAVVGLDIALTAQTTVKDDAALAKAVAEFADNAGSRVVLTASTMPASGPLASLALLQSVVRGSADIPEDHDGVIRRVAPLVPQSGDRFDPAFGLAVAARFGGIDQRTLEAALERRAIPLPVLRSGERRAERAPVGVRPGEFWQINFVGPAKSFLTIPSEVVAALSDSEVGIATNNPFRDRVVLVGATFQDSRDFFETPHKRLPGVEVHANVVHMLLTRSFIQPSGWLMSLGIQIMVVLGAGAAMVLTRPLLATILIMAGAPAMGVVTSYLAFQRGGYWIDFTLPGLLTGLLGKGAEWLKHRQFRETFARYVSPELAGEVLAEAPNLEGDRRDVSIVFSGLQGFTNLSAAMPPKDVAAYLSEYFDAMTEAAFQYRGMVNDFSGDAVMAVFGAPLTDQDHALHAVHAAVDMKRRLQALKKKRWNVKGLRSVGMGISIHTGEVFAGTVGRSSRPKYKIVGDAVNVAAQVVTLNAKLGTTILVSEATRSVLGEQVTVRDCGPIPLEGQSEPVRVFELLGVNADSRGTTEKAET